MPTKKWPFMKNFGYWLFMDSSLEISSFTSFEKSWNKNSFTFFNSTNFAYIAYFICVLDFFWYFKCYNFAISMWFFFWWRNFLFNNGFLSKIFFRIVLWRNFLKKRRSQKLSSLFWRGCFSSFLKCKNGPELNVFLDQNPSGAYKNS